MATAKGEPVRLNDDEVNMVLTGLGLLAQSRRRAANSTQEKELKTMYESLALKADAVIVKVREGALF